MPPKPQPNEASPPPQPGNETLTLAQAIVAEEATPARKRKAEDEDAVDNGIVKKTASGDANGGSVNVKVNAKSLDSDDALITSDDPLHPANHICSLCHQFYGHGWVTGTGGGISIRQGDHVFLAPSGVQKELMKPKDIFVMHFPSREYLRRPQVLKPSACTPLFMAAYTKRGAGACIHTHSQWAVLVTLILESGAQNHSDHGKNAFCMKEIEQIKGISRGGTGSQEIAEGGRKLGNLGYYDTMKIPVIENTAHEEDLKDTLEQAIAEWPETCAVLVRRHGVYVWGKDVAQAKTQCESLDYLFQLAVEMHKMGLKWV